MDRGVCRVWDGGVRLVGAPQLERQYTGELVDALRVVSGVGVVKACWIPHPSTGGSHVVSLGVPWIGHVFNVAVRLSAQRAGWLAMPGVCSRRQTVVYLSMLASVEERKPITLSVW